MNRLIIVVWMWLGSLSIATAQTLGEAVHDAFGKSKAEIAAILGEADYIDVDVHGNPMMGYQTTFPQNGQKVPGLLVFYFRNQTVYELNIVQDKRYYLFWSTEFEKKLVQRDVDAWIEPEYRLIWHKAIIDNKVYVRGTDNNAVRKIAPYLYKEWPKEKEAEFMKKCMFDNPDNLGKEAQIQPLCTCILTMMKELYPSNVTWLQLRPSDVSKLLKGCK